MVMRHCAGMKSTHMRLGNMTTDPTTPARWHEERLRRHRWLIADAAQGATEAQARECERTIESIDTALVAFGYERTEDEAAREAA